MPSSTGAVSEDDAGLTLGRDLARAIADVLSEVPTSKLSVAARELSGRYRRGESPFVRSDLDALAYAAVRMPATYAAARHALGHVRRAMGGWCPRRQLDLGSGLGAAAWAAGSTWSDLEEVVLTETDARMRRLGEAMAHDSQAGWHWRSTDVAAELTSGDLVTACYVLGELGAAKAAEVALAAWAVTAGCLVIVEPGTPAGFALVRELRGQLISAGGQVAAPCPGDAECPMTENDWCHFAARLARSALHRSLKEADRSFEDEKFSYVAVSRLPVERPAGRIVRRPAARRRYVELTVCAGGDLVKRGIGRSNPGWREVSAAAWGDGASGAILAAGPPETT